MFVVLWTPGGLLDFKSTVSPSGRSRMFVFPSEIVLLFLFKPKFIKIVDLLPQKYCVSESALPQGFLTNNDV